MLSISTSQSSGADPRARQLFISYVNKQRVSTSKTIELWLLSEKAESVHALIAYNNTLISRLTDFISQSTHFIVHVHLNTSVYSQYIRLYDLCYF